MYFGGMTLTSPFSTSSTFFPGASPVRFATRKICVSTAIVIWLKAVFKTTFAVLRPTPGSASSASRSAGTSPPCFSSNISDIRIMFFDLVGYRLIVLTYDLRPSTPSAMMDSGVLATGYSLSVALLTEISVAWADNMTATSSS